MTRTQLLTLIVVPAALAAILFLLTPLFDQRAASEKAKDEALHRQPCVVETAR